MRGSLQQLFRWSSLNVCRSEARLGKAERGHAQLIPEMITAVQFTRFVLPVPFDGDDVTRHAKHGDDAKSFSCVTQILM